MVLGPADVSVVSLDAGATGAWQPVGSATRHPVAVVDDDGAPAPADTSTEAGRWVDGLLARVGDPVPVRVGARSWPAELLVARVLAAAMPTAAAAPVDHLVLVVPDQWRDHRREALRQCVADATGLLPVLVGASTALADTGDDTRAEGPVLVIAAGAESFRADVCTRSVSGWQVDRSGLVEWGGADIDDALVGFVSEHASAAAPDRQAGSATRSACVTAREELVHATATEVNVPGGEPVRLVRADLEHLVGGTVVDVVDQLVTDVLGRRRESDSGDHPDVDFSRVLLTGPLASVPMVVEAVSAAVGTPIEHVTEAGAHRRYACVGVRAPQPHEDAAADADVDPTPSETSDIADVSAMHHRVQSHSRRGTGGRRSAAVVAAALAAAASVAAVTMTSAGESALLSLVENTVPQDASANARGGSLAGAAVRPPLPWEDEEDSDDETPRPASTNGPREQDSESTTTDADGATTGDPSSDGTSSSATATSDTTSADGTTSETSTDAADDDTTPPEDSSAGSDPTAPTSDGPSGESSAPPTSEPDPSTSDPSPEPDPTTTTDPPPDPEPEPDPTTTTSDPAPEPTGTSGTTSTTTDPLPEPTTP